MTPPSSRSDTPSWNLLQTKLPPRVGLGAVHGQPSHRKQRPWFCCNIPCTLGVAGEVPQAQTSRRRKGLKFISRPASL